MAVRHVYAKLIIDELSFFDILLFSLILYKKNTKFQCSFND